MAWRGAHPETLRSIKHKYRAKRAVGGQYTADDVRELMKLQKRKCAHPWCRKSLAEVYHVDHRIPLALGGSNDRTNIQLLCPSCNHKKQAKHPVDYAKQNGFLV
jgi:5-methylcytosine-specific restriction endonuclease McrA